MITVLALARVASCRVFSAFPPALGTGAGISFRALKTSGAAIGTSPPSRSIVDSLSFSLPGERSSSLPIAGTVGVRDTGRDTEELARAKEGGGTGDASAMRASRLSWLAMLILASRSSGRSAAKRASSAARSSTKAWLEAVPRCCAVGASQY
ncbi:hypothetical protein B0H10DRAFT_827488 [Mycena sp. CBHHK59/15]|nr:hypothetical protein B0H10DRAFT_827488 [Mycena sp. CBHHK59/15]